MKAGNDEAMKKVEGEATLQKMEALIQNVPINAYYEITDTFYKRPSNKKQQNKRQDHRPKHNKDRDRDEDIQFSEEELLEMIQGPLTIDQLTKRFNEKIEVAAENMARGNEKDTDHRVDMRYLLMDYRNQLTEAVQFMRAKGETPPPSIIEAINYINNQMGFRHWAGSSQPQPEK